MKHDLTKLSRRLVDEVLLLTGRLKSLPDDANSKQLDRAALLIRDAIASVRNASNLVAEHSAKEHSASSA